MTGANLDGLPVGPAPVAAATDAVLAEFLARKVRAARELGMPAEVGQVLHDFLFAGGKRLRPLLCVCGWYAGGGHGDTVPEPVIRAAAALEMFHAFALIHDDVMDRSDTRRGRPTVHRALTALYQGGRDHAVADHLGASTAVLIGDLALVWSDEIFPAAELDPARRARSLSIIHEMRTEVMYGQYLDLLATGRPAADVDHALTIARYKTAKYTIERPLQLGAVIAGAGSGVHAALTAYALPVGEAFQLRDDLLGVFGDSAVTGKSHLDDLRDGKQTVLLALAIRHADAGQRQVLRHLVGSPALDEDAAAEVRTVMERTGARKAVERMIHARREQALRAVDDAPFPAGVRTAFRQLADVMTGGTRNADHDAGTSTTLLSNSPA